MIVFDLQCRPLTHRFEGWFGSSEDFAAQLARGLVTCPHCGSGDVVKAVMAPNVGRKGNQLSVAASKQTDPVPPGGDPSLAGGQLAPEARQALEALAALQAEAIRNSRWVGESFAEQSRAIHYGERQAEAIHGQATPAQAKELIEEGIAVLPLPFPVAPPDKTN